MGVVWYKQLLNMQQFYEHSDFKQHVPPTDSSSLSITMWPV